MTPRMQPLRDANGNLTPELDKRDVPLAVMAAYVGVHPHTLYEQMTQEHFPKAATSKHGTRTYYKPWVWVQVREAPVSA